MVTSQPRIWSLYMGFAPLAQVTCSVDLYSYNLVQTGIISLRSRDVWYLANTYALYYDWKKNPNTYEPPHNTTWTGYT